jgi:uncharacterized membrane protein
VIDRVLAALNSARGRRIRVVAAFWAIPISLILWPVSSFTFAKNEPISVLGLSWIAITGTAIEILTSSQIHEENGDDDGSHTDGDDADGS